MVDAFEFVVEVQLRRHQYKAKESNKRNASLQAEPVVTSHHPIAFIERVKKIDSHERNEKVVHVPDWLAVDGCTFEVGLAWLQPDEWELAVEDDWVGAGDFPESNGDIDHVEDYH